VVRALPSAILGEVALNPSSAQGVGGDVDGDAEVVAREANVLDAVRVILLQEADVEEADVLEGHRVARGAVVEHDAVLGVALALLPELTISSISALVVMPVEMWTSPEY